MLSGKLQMVGFCLAVDALYFVATTKNKVDHLLWEVYQFQGWSYQRVNLLPRGLVF